MNKELLSTYWDNYKADFGSESFQKSEAYKWNLFHQMYPIWNWKPGASNKDMFTKTFQVDGPKNLWQSGNFFPISMLTWMWEKFPIETEKALNLLFDEKIELSERITEFTTILDEKLPELAKLITEKPINHHYHGDLRAISIYLALQNPSKYFLYKHTVFKDFSIVLELPPVKTGKTSNYLDFLSVCNELRGFIQSDSAFLLTYKSYLSTNDLYPDPYLHLLIQDFMLFTMSQNKSTHLSNSLKYWLYAPGENANMWEDFHKNGIMGLGWDELGDLTQYSTKEEIATRLKELYEGDTSKANDATANVDFRSSISIGDIVIAKKGRNAYLGYGIVTSDYYFDDSVAHYKHKRNVNWVKSGHWESEHSIVLKTLTDITNLPYKPNPSMLAHEAILNIMNDTNPEEMNHTPLNQILYGPPGTGKTFTLNKEYFSKYTSNETSLSADQHFINVVGECSWWQVIAIALMQEGKSKVSALSENKWIKQKAALSNSNTVRPTLWSQLQSHTIEQCSFVNVKAKQQPFIFNKTEDSFWEILPEEVKENAPELLDLIESVENFKPRTDKKIERFVFTTFHQGYSYEDFIEGIKPVLEENDGQLQYQIEDGIFKRLCLKAESDPQNKYAIFIDEINRGNVSAIFGELITLIEADKRKGAANELTVILPYSKRSFSVPSNIDIYGTMNTADRSVEALDTALRRRFSFVEMLPDASKLENKQIEGIDLALLLNTLNERIEVLVDRDHTIGHAFFMNVETLSDLRSAFANKIIPLLQEYFYGNYRKMEMVIGSAFFHITEANKVKFAVKSDDFDADGTVYHIKNISNTDGMSDASFIEALTQLIQGA
jgi:hypothetical protein